MACELPAKRGVPLSRWSSQAVGAGDPEAQGDREGMAEGWTERTLGRFMLHAGLANDSGAGSGGR